MSYIGLHQQDPVHSWDFWHHEAALAGSPFRVLKSFHPEDYHYHLRHISPKTTFVYRHHIMDDHQGEFIERAGQGSAQADAAADDYIAHFRDSVNQYMHSQGFAESLNEEYPTNNTTKLRKAIAFDRAFVRRLPVHCPGVRPVVFTAAIGNPGHHEYGELVQLARETAQAGGAFGYHAYWTVYQGRSFVGSAQHQRDLHMRWDLIDRYLVSEHGIRVKWVLGEVAATRGNEDGYNPDVIEGWKSSNVWGGNEDAYLADIAHFDKVLAGSLAAREGRLIGATLFTSRPGDGGTWHYFNVKDSMLEKLTHYVIATPTPEPPPPPPPPDPDPEPDPDPRVYVKEAHLMPPPHRLPRRLRIAIMDHVSQNAQTAVYSADDWALTIQSELVEVTARRLHLWNVEQILGVPELEARARIEEFINIYYPEPAPELIYQRIGKLFIADKWDSPIGDREQRRSVQVPPEPWFDANPFLNHYSLGYHTGADFNLPGDLDRNAPVYAAASGKVTYADQPSRAWQNVVIIRHELPDGSYVYSRSAHLHEMFVDAGEWVKRGEMIGTTGRNWFNELNAWGPWHLHFDISHTSRLLNVPGDWPGENLNDLLRHYQDPVQFIIEHRTIET